MKSWIILLMVLDVVIFSTGSWLMGRWFWIGALIQIMSMVLSYFILKLMDKI
ncbi:MAG: hypothetical protein ACRCTZ_18365 [Sarcina sp.]